MKTNQKKPLEFEYVNYKGIKEIRKVIPTNLYFGTHEWFYKEPQWLLEAFDINRGEYRIFAVSKIRGTLNQQFDSVAILLDRVNWAILELPKIHESIKGRRSFTTLMKALKRYRQDLKPEFKLTNPDEESW